MLCFALDTSCSFLCFCLIGHLFAMGSITWVLIWGSSAFRDAVFRFTVLLVSIFIVSSSKLTMVCLCISILSSSRWTAMFVSIFNIPSFMSNFFCSRFPVEPVSVSFPPPTSPDWSGKVQEETDFWGGSRLCDSLSGTSNVCSFFPLWASNSVIPICIPGSICIPGHTVVCLRTSISNDVLCFTCCTGIFRERLESTLVFCPLPDCSTTCFFMTISWSAFWSASDSVIFISSRGSFICGANTLGGDISFVFPLFCLSSSGLSSLHRSVDAGDACDKASCWWWTSCFEAENPSELTGEPSVPYISLDSFLGSETRTWGLILWFKLLIISVSFFRLSILVRSIMGKERIVAKVSGLYFSCWASDPAKKHSSLFPLFIVPYPVT